MDLAKLVAVGVTYTTVTAQPTAEQARQIACLPRPKNLGHYPVDTVEFH